MAEDLYVVAIMTAKPNKADDLRALLLPATQAFRNEDGCKAYALHEDEKRPGRFITYETWRDHDALNAHMSSPTMQKTTPQLKCVLECDMEQYFLSTLIQL
jgi:quinol monooxygenase YgiN